MISASARDRIAVAGGGPAGLVAALALSRLAPVRLIAPAPPPGSTERRTAALFTGSIALLRNLGVWDALVSTCEPMSGIRIVDDTGGLLRAPEVVFTAAEVGLETFGYNVPNDALNSVLRAAVATAEIELIDDAVADVETGGPFAKISLASGRVAEAALVAAADGRGSPCRASARIPTRTWSYPQAAIVTTFAHGRPHRGISTEFHRPAGPLTTVPMPGARSSLVWVDRPEEGKRLMALDAAAFLAELEERLQGLLGTLSGLTGRAMFPMSGLVAEPAGARRVALAGEALHVFPPIGAQGLNLGLRDVAQLADCVADAQAHGRDIGGPETLAAYAAARAKDVSSRVNGVDLMNRTLIADILPTHLARGFALHALSSIGPLRRLLVREGLQPSFATPRLMRPEAAPPAPGKGQTGVASGV